MTNLLQNYYLIRIVTSAVKKYRTVGAWTTSMSNSKVLAA